MDTTSVSAVYLSQIKSISALKTLIAFLSMGERLGKDEFEYSIKQISVDFNLSENSVRVGIKELVSLGTLEVTEKNYGKSNIYKLLLSPLKSEDVKNSTPVKVEVIKNEVGSKIAVVESEEIRAEYKVATAVKKKKEVQQSEIEKDIYNIDFNNINLYTEDINSFTVLNKNNYMNTDEIKKLSQRILVEVFIPFNKPPLPMDNKAYGIWLAKQNRIMCKLLTEYRTEQVIASIRYFAEIAPPPNGVYSAYFYLLTKKTKYGMATNAMKALDYYKAEYVANAHEYNKEEIEQKRIERDKHEQEEKEIIAKKAEEIANMKPDEFVAGMLGRFKLNMKKDE